MKLPPVFVINLPKDKDRRFFMEKQLGDLGLEYQFIEGRYGSDPIVVEGCNDELAIKEHGKVLMTGEKGCAFSHRLVYEKIIKGNFKMGLILEDDILLPDNFIQILERELSRKKISWDWLSFDYPRIGFDFVWDWIIASKKMTQKNKFFFFYALIKFPYILFISILELVRNFFAKKFTSFSGPKIFYRPLYNAGAYLVTENGINKMKPLLYPLRFSADRTPNIARLKNGLKMRWYVPKVARQMDDIFGSNTIY